jgi:hypothetical protein
LLMSDQGAAVPARDCDREIAAPLIGPLVPNDPAIAIRAPRGWAETSSFRGAGGGLPITISATSVTAASARTGDRDREYAGSSVLLENIV